MPTTGDTELPDIGVLFYNGVEFNSLVRSKMSSTAVKDAANRTVKLVEHTLTVEAVVTLVEGEDTTDATMRQLRIRLDQQGGTLVYEGRGFGTFSVNAQGGRLWDVAWGPIPETLSFQPLGAGRAALVVWTVTTRIPEVQNAATMIPGQLANVLQFNQESTLTYDENGYSIITIRGTLEMPLTRLRVTSNAVPATVDQLRERFMTLIFQSFSLSKFRITRRSFPVSRDKRTMEWEFQAEELPPMGLPANATNVRGTFSVRPTKSGSAGLASWNCSLRATYTIRKGFPRRLAWLHFFALLQYRMRRSAIVDLPGLADAGGNAQQPGPNFANDPFVVGGGIPNEQDPFWPVAQLLQNQPARLALAFPVILIHFGFDEGLYLDSKEMSFEATWKLMTTFAQVLQASGVWRWLPGTVGGGLWATTIAPISGWRGNLENNVVAGEDVIVDFGAPV